MARFGYSLRRRLFIRLFGLLTVLAGGLFLFVDAYAQRAADAAFDRLLTSSALAVADALRVEDGRIVVEMPYSALAILAQARRDRVFYRIDAPGGGLITGYEDLPFAAADAAPAPDEAPGFLTAQYRGAAVRIATLRRLIALPGASAARSGTATISVAQTREARDDMAADLLANAFLPIILALAAGGGLLWFGVRQALTPLKELERIIRARPPHDFSPIDAPAPREVAPLVAAINQSMTRLGGALDAMQTFLADAAHQIRTPLAGLRAQAELAADEDDPDALRRIVGRIRRNAVDASRLANQLLNHAMVAHRGETRRPEDVDLGQLLEQVAQRERAVAEDMIIRLNIDPACEPASTSGDMVALREALANLLENAVKYGGAGGVVDVSLSAGGENGALRIDIADRGPGVPDEEKTAVRRRFGRGKTAAGTVGSGLGLAIVDTAAEAHGAALTLLDRPGGGLIARLEFPRRWSALFACFAFLALCASTGPGNAMETTLHPAPGGETARLVLHSATDRQAISPLIRGFQQTRPETAVVHVEMENAELYVRAVARDGQADADLLISSAVDLQVKLVNDGLTRPYVSPLTRGLPDWANWRDEAFGLTFEPAVIAYNPNLLPAEQVPHSREALIRFLHSEGAGARGRVATYDAQTSGLGYLFAAHDAVLFSRYWQLTAALGAARARLLCCTAEILDLIERGEVILGYNVLGSYARARMSAGAPIAVVMPQDYTLVIARAAVIPRAAPRPDLAGAFIDFLLSAEGQRLIAGPAGLYAISSALTGDGTAAAVRAAAEGPLQPIGLSPALLAFLDRMKRDRFVKQWRSLTAQP